MTAALEKSDARANSWYRWHGIVSQPSYRVIEYFKRYGNPVDPTVLDNYSTKAREYAYRAFGPAALVGAAIFLAKHATLPQIGLLFAGLLALEVGRTALHILGFSAQKKNYIHVRGDGAEIHSTEPKIMSWNILGFPAGMNYTCGGCIPFRNRFPEIVKTIRDEKPDIAILQECLMDASVSEAFIKEFKKEYAHFYIHNGPNKLGLESGLLVMTKNYVSDYTFTRFKTNDWTLSRGFATLTIPATQGRPAFAVIGTHMEAGSAPEDAKKRKDQLDHIQADAKMLPCETVILAGDLNIDAGLKPEREFLENVLVSVNAPPQQATCTNELNKIRYPDAKSPPEEWIDQIAVIKRDKAPKRSLTEFKVIPVYKENGKINYRTARSDHNPVVATFK
jgi:exonuclease III